MKLPSKVYDVLKWLVVIVIPALTTFYAVLDTRVFNWGYAEAVTTISAALCTCLGVIIGISTAEYNKER